MHPVRLYGDDRRYSPNTRQCKPIVCDPINQQWFDVMCVFLLDSSVVAADKNCCYICVLIALVASEPPSVPPRYIKWSSTPAKLYPVFSCLTSYGKIKFVFRPSISYFRWQENRRPLQTLSAENRASDSGDNNIWQLFKRRGPWALLFLFCCACAAMLHSSRTITGKLHMTSRMRSVEDTTSMRTQSAQSAPSDHCYRGTNKLHSVVNACCKLGNY